MQVHTYYILNSQTSVIFSYRSFVTSCNGSLSCREPTNKNIWYYWLEKALLVAFKASVCFKLSVWRVKSSNSICNPLLTSALQCENCVAVSDNFSNFPKMTIQQVCPLHAAVSKMWGEAGFDLPSVHSSDNYCCHFLCVRYCTNVCAVNPTSSHLTPLNNSRLFSAHLWMWPRETARNTFAFRPVQTTLCMMNYSAWSVSNPWLSSTYQLVEPFWYTLHWFLPYCSVFCMNTHFKFLAKAAIERKLRKNWIKISSLKPLLENFDNFWTHPSICLLMLKDTVERGFEMGY